MLYKIKEYSFEKGSSPSTKTKYLILDQSCLLKQFSDLDIDHLQIRHLEPRLFPEYFYANLVIFKGGEESRVMKSPIKTERIIYTDNMEDFMNYIFEHHDKIGQRSTV
jgi:hypothetical protein